MRAFALSRSRSLLRPHATAPLSFWAPWRRQRGPPTPDADSNADADAVSAELARHPEYRVIAPDFGGMGDSGHIAGQHVGLDATAVQFVDELAAIGANGIGGIDHRLQHPINAQVNRGGSG
jgi:hypothetical protein